MAGFCPKCGSMILSGSKYCKSCGYNFSSGCIEPVINETRPHIQPKIIDSEDPELPFFPYEPRSVQKEIIKDIVTALDDNRHIVIESGTGTGKTIVSLASALDHAFRNNKRILYLTRTISQSDQVMRELRAIGNLRKVTGMTVTGRGRSCPLLRTMSNYETMHPSVLASLCEDHKKKGTCSFYQGLKERIVEVENYAENALPTSEELDKFCEEKNICPYEAKKSLLSTMKVVVAPYVHILSEDIRGGFLGNLQSDGTNLVIIVDEAHNLIDAAREQESYTIKTALINAAIDEISTMKGDPPIFEDVTLKPFLKEIKDSVKFFATEKIQFGKKEALLKSDCLEERIMKKFELIRDELQIAINRMISYGEERTELLMDNGETKISDIYTLGIDLKNWMLSNPDKYIKSIKVDDDDQSLHAACIDPYNVIEFLRSVKSVIHMSGTLQPLDQYVNILSLPKDTVCKIYDSPFPKENKSVIYLGNVTTRYEDMQKDPSIFSRIEKNVAKLCNNVNKNTLVFFPSYSMMSRMKPFLERDVHKNLYWEESRQQKRTMNALYQFRKGRDGVFFTVMGGSIAEGIDFPGDELCFAIIIGIPYPPPTLESKAMSDLFDQKYGPGTGWKYTSEVPALRKMQQAIGRLIRTETDRGMAVIFDKRASKYEKILSARLSNDHLGDVVSFFEKE